MATREVGEGVRFWWVFRDIEGEQVDAEATFDVLRPDGDAETYTVEEATEGDVTVAAEAMGETLIDETGVRYADVVFDLAGTWWMRLEVDATLPKIRQWPEAVRPRMVPEAES